MISPLLEKLFGLILEFYFCERLEDNNKRAKWQGGFRDQHATLDPFPPLDLLLMIVETK
jgi:hypothetical protein